MDKSIVVPLGLFLAVVYTIKLLVDARMRYLFFKGGAPDTVEALFRGEERVRRLSSLRWGLVLLCLALGMGLAGAMGWQPLSLPSIAMLLGALGVGNIVAFLASQHLDKPPA